MSGDMAMLMAAGSSASSSSTSHLPPPDHLRDVVGDDLSEFFYDYAGRKLNSLNRRYMLPADEDEQKRSGIIHRLVQFILEGKHYVGPVRDILSRGRQDGQQRAILDIGTGDGSWAIQMADEFPRVEVTGVDLAPLQPMNVPANCTFELCDMDVYPSPYASNQFDVVHARFMHTGISNYSAFLNEVARILRPGGLAIIIESDLYPLVDGHDSPAAFSTTPDAPPPPLHAWFDLWLAYRHALRRLGVEPRVPRELARLAWGTGKFYNVVAQHAVVPVGFWPKDENWLTMAQLNWLSLDLLLPGLRPTLLRAGITSTGPTNSPGGTPPGGPNSVRMTPAQVDALIEDAQRDLYNSSARISTRLHIVYATKKGA